MCAAEGGPEGRALHCIDTQYNKQTSKRDSACTFTRGLTCKIDLHANYLQYNSIPRHGLKVKRFAHYVSSTRDLCRVAADTTSPPPAVWNGNHLYVVPLGRRYSRIIRRLGTGPHANVWRGPRCSQQPYSASPALHALHEEKVPMRQGTVVHDERGRVRGAVDQ